MTINNSNCVNNDFSKSKINKLKIYINPIYEEKFKNVIMKMKIITTLNNWM